MLRLYRDPHASGTHKVAGDQPADVASWGARDAAGAGASMKVLHLTISYRHGGRREAIAALALGLRELGT